MSRVVTIALAVLLAAPFVSAQRASPQSTGRAAATPKEGPSVACAVELGAGIKTKRQFCDVIIATDRADSISITIPAHRGSATLSFDLHNRFDLPPAESSPADVYAMHMAVVAVVGPTGSIIDREAVRDEMRSTSWLFDRLAGGSGPGGVKSIAPGPPQAIRVVIPAPTVAVGIVGVRLTSVTRKGTAIVETAGQAIAIASKFSVEYTPR